MAYFYADEQYPKRVVEFLRTLGHDVLTVQEAGNANQKIPDEEVLAFALSINRAILTLNRRHFIKLHTLQPEGASQFCKKFFIIVRASPLACSVKYASGDARTTNAKLRCSPTRPCWYHCL